MSAATAATSAGAAFRIIIAITNQVWAFEKVSGTNSGWLCPSSTFWQQNKEV